MGARMQGVGAIETIRTAGVEKSDPTALSVVVPTFNERDNIAEIVSRLDKCLPDIQWEVIFVDDFSPDGTAQRIRRIAARDRRVRLITRHNRRGLSSAVIEGALAAAGDVVAVMDGDLQHDESVLPELYRIVADGEADIALASRFLLEDGADGLASDTRLKISNTGIALANMMFGLKLTDPLTGFFAIDRSVVENALPNLSGVGFKVLLDLITATRPKPRVKEIPFRFRERQHGESKLDNRVMYDFFLFFIEKKIAPLVPLPARFISFAMINGFGIFIHLLALTAMISGLKMSFDHGQLIATIIAMGFNYSANNALTYNDRRRKGWRFATGFLIFAALSSFGIVANVGIASAVHREYTSLIYLLPAALGAMITVVWNYIATQAFVWSETHMSGLGRARLRMPRLPDADEAGFAARRIRPAGTTHE